MTPSNFNQFLHAMLFYHTRLVVEKQRKESNGIEEMDEEEDEDTGNNIE